MSDGGYIALGDVPVSPLSDDEIAEWINEQPKMKVGYRIRPATLDLWIHILRVFDECGAPMTVRQMFYQLETRGYVEKSENGYRLTAKNLVQMRKRGVIGYEFITDNTRWARRAHTFETLEKCLEYTRETYRKSLWVFQPCYVEIWIEKEALIGVIDEVTMKYDVPLMPCKGYPSETFLFSAAQYIKRQNKPTYIYYFGDFDPTGKDIPRHIEKTLREFGADFTFEVMAVTEDQIRDFGLPTRPTKKSDTRAKGWNKDSVELDAITPKALRELVEVCIVKHMDLKSWNRVLETEKAERETLNNFFKQLGTSTQIYHASA